MSETQEDRLHREYSERVTELENRSKQHPDDWDVYTECSYKIEALREQLEAELAKLPKPKRKWFRR